MPKCEHASCSIVPIERALLLYCSDQYKLDELFVEHDASPIAEELGLARKRVAKLKKLWRVQPVNATPKLAFSVSAGVMKPNVFLGR